MVEDRNLWVYDIETLVNCFTYTGFNIDTKEVKQFVIWKDINQLKELIEHIKSCRGLIGFNNLSFDYPVIHFMLNEFETWLESSYSGNDITDLVYDKAQEVIGEEWSGVQDKYIKVPQLDLFRIWHYNNKARMTSLKKLQIALRYSNVQDMPYKHYDEIHTYEQVEEILEYNKNDVMSTYDFYLRTLKKIELRKGLYEKYGLSCMNYPDTKIGEELTLFLYCKETGENIDLVRKMRTRRSVFDFKDCFPEYLEFKNEEFKKLETYLSSIKVEELKGSFKYSFDFNGFGFDLGTGGIHGCIKSGVYESTEEMVIVDVDVASLYPSLAIANNLYPAHLGEVFCKVYKEGIVQPRLEAKKAGDKVMDTGFKLSANSVYGKSNSEYSWLYDPLYTLKTTLAGQLSLCMLSEQLMTQVNEMTMLQINTEGLTAIIPANQKRVFYEICKAWEKQTGLILEYASYSKMIIRDVNNYLAVTPEGKIKRKGTFVTYTQMLEEESYHKALSQPIVPHALEQYFLNNTPVEETIMKCNDIYDFCKMFNASHGWTCETVIPRYEDISYDDYVTSLLKKGYYETQIEGIFKFPSRNIETIQISKEGVKTKVYTDIIPQQKNNRYFISTNGKTFRKIKDDKIIEIEAGGKLVTMFNTFEQKSIEDYNIDYDYYIQECYKIIHKIDGTEERLLEEKKAEREQIKRDKQEEIFLKYCINKVPTVRQLNLYGKDWLLEKYGTPKTK